MTRALMFQGTGSDVGKTVLVAGLCRLARRRGLSVVPFKPQNMSNNAAVAQDGGEIGRGQWLQAFAAGVAPCVDMNPVLLKPQSETGAQVIVQGELWATAKAREYQRLKKDLRTPVMVSFDTLKRQADLILVEGAGSAAEINLRDYDIANMGFAEMAQIPVVLVGDIDRGGVIASLVGIHAILPPQDRALVAGFIINKFRGDVGLFDTGARVITDHTGWGCFGIVPWLEMVAKLPAEDDLGLVERYHDAQHAGKNYGGKKIKIAVPLTGFVANFDDLDPLFMEEGVELVLLQAADVLPNDTDMVLLLGSKSTLASMAEFVANGWVDSIRHFAARGGEVVGICGGLQMLGKRIIDPQGVEGIRGEMGGLGLLDIETVMAQQKTVRNVCGFDRRFGESVTGYEIHLGLSEGQDVVHAPILIDNKPSGAADKTGKIWGTYLHGLFAHAPFRAKYLAHLGGQSNMKDHTSIIDKALDEMADALDRVLDCNALFATAAEV